MSCRRATRPPAPTTRHPATAAASTRVKTTLHEAKRTALTQSCLLAGPTSTGLSQGTRRRTSVSARAMHEPRSAAHTAHGIAHLRIDNGDPEVGTPLRGVSVARARGSSYGAVGRVPVEWLVRG